MLGIVNIVIPATNLAKTVAKTSYSLLEYLHGMQGISGSSPLGSILEIDKKRSTNRFVKNEINAIQKYSKKKRFIRYLSQTYYL